MFAAKRPLIKPILFLIILAAFVLAACSGNTQTSNWPGMSAEGDRVYVAYGKAVIAYDTVAQSVEWTYPTGEARSQLQYYAAPSVLDGRVVFGDYGQATSLINPRQIVSVYGVSDPPGAPSDWKNSTTAHDKIIAPPLQEGSRVFVATGDNQLFALNTTTGEALWQSPFQARNPIWGPMAYAHGNVYVASMDGNIYAVDAETGTQNGLWESGSSFPGGLTLEGDTLYAGGLDDKVHAYDINSPGTAEIWMFLAETGVWGAPIVVDGQVFFGDMNGNVYGVDAKTGNLLWQATAIGPIVTSPAFSDGVIYIASEGDSESRTPSWFLTAFSTEDGKQVWQQPLTAGIYTTPVVIGDSVIGVAFGGNAEVMLIAYNKTSGTQQWTYSPTAVSK